MEQMKKEIESLKKKTFYLQLLITVTLINVIFSLLHKQDSIVRL